MLPKIFHNAYLYFHVDNIVAKANRSLGLVKCNLYPCSESTNTKLIQPLSQQTWSMPQPYGTFTGKARLTRLRQSNNTEPDLLKKIDRTSLVTEMLKLLSLHKLEDKRKVH